MDPYNWWGWGHGFGWMWIVPFAFLAVCLLVAFGFRRSVRFGRDETQTAGGESAREILDRRYAKGEINKQQYEEMKHALKA